MAAPAPSVPESMLVRRRVPATSPAAAGTLVTLHADGGDVATLLPLCGRAAAAWDVLALQAPRARNPVLASGHGDARWRGYTGYSWYRGDDARRPEPASFGDSLWQLEQIVRALTDAAAPRPLVVLGHREGAVLALTAAALLPGYVDGVVALDGDLPSLPGLDLRLAHPGPRIVWIEARSTVAEDIEAAAPLVAGWLHDQEDTRHGNR